MSDSKVSKLDQTNLYDLNLEPVQEKANDKSCLTLDVGDMLKAQKHDRHLSYNSHIPHGLTKKIVNGGVLLQENSQKTL